MDEESPKYNGGICIQEIENVGVNRQFEKIEEYLEWFDRFLYLLMNYGTVHELYMHSVPL